MPDGEIDPLRSALHEATLAVLLGSTNVHVQNVDINGQSSIYTITIASAFGDRIRSKAFQGDFDELIRQAMEKVDSSAVAKAVEGILAEQILAGLGRTQGYSSSEPNWLQARAKQIAIEACTMAMKDDTELLDTLRARIGAEVDRNRVGITVNLSDPEKS